MVKCNDLIFRPVYYYYIAGKFRADYCPGVSGCRAAVSFDKDSLNGHSVDLGNMDFVLAFNNSRGMPAWLVGVGGSQKHITADTV